MSLDSFALPAAMRACLTLVVDHLECRCGFIFEPHASFLHCREHARNCYGGEQPPKPTEPAPDPQRDRDMDAREDIAAMNRQMADAQRVWNRRNERTGLV